MNIHEYQGKEILASYGVRVQRGIVANSPVEAVAAAKQLTAETGTGWHVAIIRRLLQVFAGRQAPVCVGRKCCDSDQKGSTFRV